MHATCTYLTKDKIKDVIDHEEGELGSEEGEKPLWRVHVSFQTHVHEVVKYLRKLVLQPKSVSSVKPNTSCNFLLIITEYLVILQLTVNIFLWNISTHFGLFPSTLHPGILHVWSSRPTIWVLFKLVIHC